MSFAVVLASAAIVAEAPLVPARILDRPEPFAVQGPAVWHATVTAYTSRVEQTDDTPFITASGRRVFDGLVACPRRYAFGTRFRIGRRTYACWDRLHPRYDDRLDIWMEDDEAARRFGRRTLRVEVIVPASS